MEEEKKEITNEINSEVVTVSTAPVEISTVEIAETAPAAPVEAPVVEPAPVEAPVAAPAPVEAPVAAPEAQPMNIPVQTTAPQIDNAQPATVSQEQNVLDVSSIDSGKKSKLIIPIVVVVVLLLVLIGGFSAYKFAINNPYENAITSVMKSLHNSGKFVNNVYKTDMEIKFKSLNDEFKELDDYNISYSITNDIKNNKYQFKLDATLGKDGKYNLNSFLADNKFYIKGKNDKVYYVDLGEYADTSKFNINEEDVNYLVGKFEEALKNALKDEKRKTETKKVTIKGKEQSLKNNYYSITNKNGIRIIQNFVKVFNDDECIKKLSKMFNLEEKELKEMISEILKEGNNVDNDVEEEEFLRIGIYTKGLLDNYAGFNISTSDIEILNYVEDGDDFKLEIKYEPSFNITLEGNYEEGKVDLNCTVSGKEYLTGKYVRGTDKSEIELTIVDSLKVMGNYSVKENATIEEFDVKNAKNLEDASDEEMEEIFGDYYKSLTGRDYDYGFDYDYDWDEEDDYDWDEEDDIYPYTNSFNNDYYKIDNNYSTNTINNRGSVTNTR